jgi:hypothetical protein
MHFRFCNLKNPKKKLEFVAVAVPMRALILRDTLYTLL